MISEHDRTHVQEILVGSGTWFNAQLLRLINKADEDNIELLRKVFPDVVEAYEDWYYSRGPYQRSESDG